MKALVDENLAPALAKVLNGLAEVDNHLVLHISEIGQKGAKDVQLFAHLVSEGFGIHITQDHHHRKPAEREAISRHGLIVFVLASTWETMPLVEKAARLILWWPRIVKQVEMNRPPAVFRVPWKLGGFEQIRNVGK